MFWWLEVRLSDIHYPLMHFLCTSRFSRLSRWSTRKSKKTEILLVRRLLSCIFWCYLHFAKHSQNLSGSGSNKMKLRPQPWNCSLLTTKIGDLTIAFVVFQFFCVFRKQETQDMHWGLFVVVKWPLESLPLFFFFWFFISGFCKQDVGASLFG